MNKKKYFSFGDCKGFLAQAFLDGLHLKLHRFQAASTEDKSVTLLAGYTKFKQNFKSNS